MSSESSCVVRLARHSRNAWARHVERVESSRAKWNLSLFLHYATCASIGLLDSAHQPITDYGFTSTVAPSRFMGPNVCSQRTKAWDVTSAHRSNSIESATQTNRKLRCFDSWVFDVRRRCTSAHFPSTGRYHSL